ncbi:MAG: FAD-dependent oxidoreductase [Fimbriimonas sp.]
MSAERACQVLIVGGGTGACAAAIAACSMGMRVILTEETEWIGGQLTSQAVPPDEHPWIEQFGCTRTYRAYRDGVRRWYRNNTPLGRAARADLHLNPGGGWVSKLCHAPRVGRIVLNKMVEEYCASGLLEIWLHTVPVAASVEGDLVRSVTVRSLESEEETVVQAKVVLDATERGDLLPMTGTDYVVGSEADTGEAHAVQASPENCQAITWVFAMAHDEGSHRVIDKPASYERWRSLRPSFWPGPLLGELDLNPITNEPRKLPFWGENGFNFFTYRQIVDPSIYESSDEKHPVTVVNWPMNDYFEGTIVDVDEAVKQARLQESKELSRSLLYWLQTEMDLPGLYLRPDVTGTRDGFAMAPYVRESRRIRARFTVLEEHVSADLNPGRDRARDFEDSVGIGAYRIDLHPSTGGDSYIDLSTLPFQIPLGALIPLRIRNLLPACKNAGVTHITNGCYRLHPVEWNIGEAAGYLAAHCLSAGLEPAQVYESQDRRVLFQELLTRAGVELEWPRLRAL